MIEHQVRARHSEERLAREEQVAWKIATVATDPAEVTPAVLLVANYSQ